VSNIATEGNKILLVRWILKDFIDDREYVTVSEGAVSAGEARLQRVTMRSTEGQGQSQRVTILELFDYGG
jgi:hypothetical protein